MAINLNLSTGILFVVLVTACNHPDTQIMQQESQFLFKPLAIKQHSFQENASILGQWEYSFPFYSSELLIKKDSTFTYHSQGCTGHTYSEGTWTQTGMYFILKSLEKFRNPDITKNGNNFGFSPSDTSNLYFEKETLKLEGDTLFELNNEMLKTARKYVIKTSSL